MSDKSPIIGSSLPITVTGTRPACAEYHRPGHWKNGQSPRATHRVTFKDGGQSYYCQRCAYDGWGGEVRERARIVVRP